MNLKLIVAMVADEKTDVVIDAAREAGATGATTISSVRGEGMTPEKGFMGLELTAQRDVILFLVAGTQARRILETINTAGNFEDEPGAGVAFQIDIEDAVGLNTQLPKIMEEIAGEV
ncbi:Nitrogen regulatory protein P-II family protein [Candidatus Terasakiella magnetica]|uniref:Nitrogen regulatory protein P-II n=1 Tax=Candidatus Terasakiella magnetica TaxID=1867952 RepID=A0A1C3RCQ6_9PROT|nr:P-II family nitrogen regulator [Candidatus Terasakiella magnetica]SCA55014.1 Nitrogen regulatory protein P-II family protein [Candidatus Terasakiella magnetica]